MEYNWVEKFFDLEYGLKILHNNKELEQSYYFLEYLFKNNEVNKIYDQCCGVGDISIHFLEKGYQCYGIDQSKDYIKYIHNKYGYIDNYKVANALEYITPAKVDSVINWHTSFGYFKEDSKNIKMFQNAYKSLKKEGIFILDYINFDYVVNNFLEEFNQEYVFDNKKLLLSRKSKLEEEMLIQEWKLYNKEEIVWSNVGYTKIYFFEQLKLLLEKTGFVIQEVYGDYNFNLLNKNSNRCIIIAKK